MTTENTGGEVAAENGAADGAYGGGGDVSPEDATYEELLAHLDAADEDDEGQSQDEPEIEDDSSSSSEEDGEQESDDESPSGNIHPEHAALQKEVAEMRQMMKQQETFIGRQKSQIGDLRKARDQLIAAREQIQQGLADKDYADPGGAIEDRLALRDIDQRVNDLDAQEGYEAHVQSAQAAFNQYFKQGDVSAEEMALALQRDGVSNEEISAFVQDPYAAFSPAALVQLGHRARAETMLTKLVGAAKALKAERDQLKGELKNRRSGGDVIKSIEKAARSTPMLTAATGGSNPKRTAIAEAPHLMSDDDLMEFLANNE